jgi:3-oxoacyl-[acyl-carrier protein] reductase
MEAMAAERGDVLITGAAGAIGSAVAKELARAGHPLHLTSRDPRRLEKLKKELSASPAVFIYRMDLSKPADINQTVVKFMKQAKRPFGLVCNAGHFGVLGDLSTVPVEKWIKDFSENFVSNVRLVHAFINGLKKKRAERGSIAVMSGAGIGGNNSFAHFSCYSTAKAALTHLVEALAPELENQNIRINAISPGQVYSSLTETMIKAGVKRVGDLAISAQKCKQSGGVPPQLAADLISFLMAPNSQGISGRLLSARFDRETLIDQTATVAQDPNYFRLRRIDQTLFAAKDRS